MKKRFLLFKLSIVAGVVMASGLCARAVGLPANYTRLEWIGSTGTQYIDTGYVHDGTTVVDMKVQFTALPDNYWFAYYGSRTQAGSSDGFCAWISTSGHNGTAYHYLGGSGGVGDVKALGKVQTGVDYVAHWEAQGICTIDGQTLGTYNVGSAGVSDYLFALHQTKSTPTVGLPSQNRLYYCQIRTGATLVRDFVPCKNDENEPGLWDRVEGKFYGNAATSGGDFTTGSVVPVAYWTGAVDDDLTNMGNWLNGRAPDANTVACFDGYMPNIPANSSFVAKEIVVSATLSTDYDWRGVTVPVAGKIDLKGNNLTVLQLVGGYEITDSCPAGEYELLDFIASTGDGQYIDTGYAHDGTTVVDMKVQFTALPNNYWFAYYGSRAKAGSSDGFCAWISTSGHDGTAYHYLGGDVTALGKVQTGVDYVTHWAAKGTCTINGQTLGTYNMGSSGVSDYLFALQQTQATPKVGFASQNRLYYCQIRSGTTLKRDFVPVRRISDGKAGLLDLANRGTNEFYENKGGGVFATGVATNTISCGELHIDNATDTANTSVKISGGLCLVKEGEGTFTWSGGTFTTTAPILVTNGVFKLGVTTANVFGNTGSITVKGKGQFDLNYSVSGGSSPVLNKTFLIEGDGPDGSGAICNSAAAGNYGYHLKSVYQTGDATIGGTARIDFRSGALEGDGHTLTIKNTDVMCFVGGVLRGCADVVVTDSGVIHPCATGSIDGISGSVILQGGTFASWAASASATVRHAVPVVVGEGGGMLRSVTGTCALSGTLTVNAGETLMLGTANSCLLTGTLCGGGTITDASGKLAFSGDDNCWRMTARGWKNIEKVNLDNAPANFLTNLKKIEVTSINGGGACDLCPLLGLTAETVEQIELVVTDSSSGLPVKDCTLEIRGDRLFLCIPSGLMIILR